MNSVIDFTMGADPEFAISKGDYGDTLVCAANYSLDPYGESLGSDGGNMLFEVRPDFSTDPLEIVGNIRQVLVHRLLTKKDIKDLKWFAGSFYKNRPDVNYGGGYSLGGHIHFGLRREVLSSRASFESACKMLSHYVGLCSILIENTTEARLRRKEGYGYIADYREQEHGFEYRTPSSWLTSPYVAAAILCLAKTVMFEWLNNPRFRKPHRVYGDDIRLVNVKAFRKMFPEVWRHIQSMKLYPLYRPYIDVLHFLIENNLTWYPSVSMKEAWGLSHVGEQKTASVSLKKIWAPYVAQPLS